MLQYWRLQVNTPVKKAKILEKYYCIKFFNYIIKELMTQLYKNHFERIF